MNRGIQPVLDALGCDGCLACGEVPSMISPNGPDGIVLSCGHVICRLGMALARPLMSLAHRIHSLEDGLSHTEADDDRRGWLERRLQEKQETFRNQDELVSLKEEWIPKSQVIIAVRRVE